MGRLRCHVRAYDSRRTRTDWLVGAWPIQRHARVSSKCHWTFRFLQILTRVSSGSRFEGCWAFAKKSINCCQLLAFRGTLSASQWSTGVSKLASGFQELGYLSPSQNPFQRARTYCQISKLRPHYLTLSNISQRKKMSMMGAFVCSLPTSSPLSFFWSRPASLFTTPSTPSTPFYQSPSGHSQPVWPGLPLTVPLCWISCLAAGPSASSLCLEPQGC